MSNIAAVYNALLWLEGFHLQCVALFLNLSILKLDGPGDFAKDLARSVVFFSVRPGCQGLFIRPPFLNPLLRPILSTVFGAIFGTDYKRK